MTNKYMIRYTISGKELSILYHSENYYTPFSLAVGKNSEHTKKW